MLIDEGASHVHPKSYHLKIRVHASQNILAPSIAAALSAIWLRPHLALNVEYHINNLTSQTPLCVSTVLVGTINLHHMCGRRSLSTGASHLGLSHQEQH
jgi:hypothetical protein